MRFDSLVSFSLPTPQAKQTPVTQMRQAGRQQRQNVTANRQSDQRQKKLAQKRGLQQQQPAAIAPIATPTQPMLVYVDAKGQQLFQPVAVVQQPGQVGAQVIPTGAPQRSGPLFKSANRQPTNQRRQSGGNQNGNQRQQGNQRQGGARNGRGNARR